MGVSMEDLLSRFGGLRLSGRNTQEYCALAGTAGAGSLALLGGLSLLDLQLSLLVVMRQLAQCLLLAIGGLTCLQGERSSRAQLMDSFHAIVQEYFGFAMLPLGRAAAYALAALYCIGCRAAAVVEEESVVFRVVWYVCCMVASVGSAASVFGWRAARQHNQLLGVEEDIVDDAYHRSYQTAEPFDSYQPPGAS
mmetsp:Transcript_71064/g.185048  ORF Transcript_71064/g.185048 Transcript_71064/m.185048 type:complete len:194 (-) Transcript_71064:91-672(-)